MTLSNSTTPRAAADAPWEPWAPLRGQRVRIRLSAECPGTMGIAFPGGHPPEFDRQLGQVYDVLDPARFHGHRFCVILDTPVVVADFEHRPFSRIQCSAIELEPEDAA